MRYPERSLLTKAASELYISGKLRTVRNDVVAVNARKSIGIITKNAEEIRLRMQKTLIVSMVLDTSPS